MWQNIERATIEARPEAVWSALVDDAGALRITPASKLRPGEERHRLDLADPPRELRWTSFPPLDDGETEEHQLEVMWWFKLTPGRGFTTIEHGFRLPNPRAGVAELAAQLDRTGRIRALSEEMRHTLERLDDAVR